MGGGGKGEDIKEEGRRRRREEQERWQQVHRCVHISNCFVCTFACVCMCICVCGCVCGGVRMRARVCVWVQALRGQRRTSGVLLYHYSIIHLPSLETEFPTEPGARQAASKF